MYIKWWKEEGLDMGEKCDLRADKKEITSELNLGKIGGIFFIVISVLVLAIIIVIIEFSVKIKKVSSNMVY